MDDFPQTLRRWRARARLSQLAAAAEAGVSARHLACLETGRARPSRAMVLRLAEALDVPPHAVNALLEAAGFAPRFVRRPLEGAELAPIRAAFEGFLHRHDPYPGYLMDAEWRLIRLNRAATGLLRALGLGEGDSLLSLFADPARGALVFENWAEVGHHLLLRLRSESRAAGGSAVLDRAAAALARDPAVSSFVPDRPEAPSLPTRIRTGQGVLALWSMMIQPGAATDLTVTELRAELLFPADDEADAALRTLADLPFQYPRQIQPPPNTRDPSGA